MGAWKTSKAQLAQSTSCAFLHVKIPVAPKRTFYGDSTAISNCL